MEFPELRGIRLIGLDTETTGLNYPADRAFCFGVAWGLGAHQVVSYDIRHTPQAARWLLDLFTNNPSLEVTAHNASFDHRMLSAAGIHIPIERWHDTVNRATQINEHEATIFPWTRKKGGYSLDYLCQKYLDEKKTGDELYVRMAAVLGGRATKNVQMAQIARAPWDIVKPYVEKDTQLALALWHWQEEEIAAQGIHEIVDFERRLMPTIVRAEMRGINVDIPYAEEAISKLDKVVDEQQSALNKACSGEVNINSPKQIRELFQPKKGADGHWYSQDGTALQETPSGNPSMNADALRNMKDPRAKDIVELRSTIKTRDTFFKKHILANEINGIVYPNINQSKGEDGGTGTGRLSYSDPAMQQIPSRNKRIAAIVKPAFLPPEGMLWLDSDMASFEVRIFAHLVAKYNPSVADVYKKAPNTDFHQYVADLTGLPRGASYAGEANAKQLNLSMIFNSGNGAIAEKMGMPYTMASFVDKSGKTITYKKAGAEATAVIQRYHRQIQGVDQLADRAKQISESRGYIKTRHGRRLRFPHGYKSYKASGLLIQATAADENKENWMRIEEALGENGHIILNTHDSYSMAVDQDWQPIWDRVRKAVERDNLRVPLLLDFNGVGKNWWEALQGNK